MNPSEVAREAWEWHVENETLHGTTRHARWMEADEPGVDDEEEDWQCPLCGRKSCDGRCPV